MNYHQLGKSTFSSLQEKHKLLFSKNYLTHKLSFLYNRNGIPNLDFKRK